MIFRYPIEKPNPTAMITTPRLYLYPCDENLFEAIRMGNATLSTVLSVNVPKKWTHFRDAFTPAYHHWLANPELRDWWTYLIVSREHQMLIGSCGYKGAPDAEGVVEIGYEIMSTLQNKGLGTEAAGSLITNAFNDPRVTVVRAHTLADENASVKLLKKLHFEQKAKIDDPEEGLLWRWELPRNAYNTPVEK